MQRVLILVWALSLAASTAWAGSGIQLSLGDCSTGSSVNSITNACTTNSGTAFDLVASCVLPAVTHSQFVGAVGRLVVQFPNSSGDAVPDWWRGDACRQTAFYLRTDGVVGASCPNFWDAHPAAGVNVTAILDPNGYASRVELLMGAVLSADGAYDLVGDGATEKTVFDLQVLNLHTVGLGSCGGCDVGACIVLTEIDFEGLTDTPGTFLKVTNPYVRHWLTYQATDVPPCPASVPVKNRTWGALKSLYR